MDLTSVFTEAATRHSTVESAVNSIMGETTRSVRQRLSPVPNPLRKQAMEFTRISLEIMEHNRTLCSFLGQHGRDYIAPSWMHGHMSDSEREAVDLELRRGIEQACIQIDELRGLVAPSTDLRSHEEGVIAALYEAVENAASEFAALKESRLRNAMSQRRDELHGNKDLVQENDASMALFDHVAAAGRAGRSVLMKDSEQREETEVEFDIASGLSAQELTTLTKENTMLQRELDCLGDQLSLVEGQVADVTSLQQVLSARVLEQTEQIDKIQQETEESTQYVRAGTRELSKAASSSSTFRLLVLFVFVVASFALLFLDWYQ